MHNIGGLADGRQGWGRRVRLSAQRAGQACLAMGLFGVAPVYAQDVPAAAASETATEEDVPSRRAREVPPGKFLDVADTQLMSMRDQMSQGLEQLSAARAANDAIKLQCVSNKVTAMKGVLRISEDAFVSMQEALATGAEGKARNQFSRISANENKMRELVQGVYSCAGSESSSSGEGSVSVEVDPAITVTADAYYGSPDLFYSPDSAMADASSQESSLSEDDGTDTTSGGSFTSDSTGSSLVTSPPVVSSYEPSAG